MLKNIFIVLFLSIVSIQAKTYEDKITNFTIIKVRDGDTFVIKINDTYDVFGEEIAVRIRGIDTPELKDEREEIRKIAELAKEELENLFKNAKTIELYNLGRDKYFRLLASVKVDGVDVAKYMIKKGLAKEYDGGKKVW